MLESFCFKNFLADKGVCFLFVCFLSFIANYLVTTDREQFSSALYFSIVCNLPLPARSFGGSFQRFQDCAAHSDSKGKRREKKHLLPHLFATLRDTRSYLIFNKKKKRKKSWELSIPTSLPFCADIDNSGLLEDGNNGVSGGNNNKLKLMEEEEDEEEKEMAAACGE